jgi:hypothetical protein
MKAKEPIDLIADRAPKSMEGGGMNLGVEHDGPKDANAVHGCAEVVELLLVVLAGAVGEFEVHDVIAGARSSRRSARSGRACTQSWSWAGAEPSTPSPRAPLPSLLDLVEGREGGRGNTHVSLRLILASPSVSPSTCEHLGSLPVSFASVPDSRSSSFLLKSTSLVRQVPPARRVPIRW